MGSLRGYARPAILLQHGLPPRSDGWPAQVVNAVVVQSELNQALHSLCTGQKGPATQITVCMGDRFCGP